eukprot:12500-Heterococcus_DN1.PRE.3
MVHSLELYSRNSSSSDSSIAAAAAASHWGSDASAVTAFYSSTSSSSSSVLQYLHAWAMAWPEPGGWWLAWWLFQQVVLLQIFFSPRFVHVVGRLWRGPIFAFYCKLYMYFVGACWAFPATWTPALTRMTPRLLAAAGGAKAQQVLDRDSYCVTSAFPEPSTGAV